MSITTEIFLSVKSSYPSLMAKTFGPNDTITGITCCLFGIKGSHKKDEISYEVFLELDNFTNPTFYVLSPSDQDIYHVNIWPPKPCKGLKANYPWICFGNNQGLWQESKEKTLLSLLNSLNYVLRHENHGSKARQPR